MSIHYLERIESGNRDGLCLWIRWNKTRMVVHIDPSPAGNLIQDSLIKEYEDAVCNSQREEDAMTDKILDTIVEVGRSTFDRNVPPKDKAASPPSLHSLLFPEEFTFLLHTRHKDGQWILETSAQSPDLSMTGALPLDLELLQGADLSIFSTKDIFVVDEIISDGRVSRVIVEDQEMCAKTAIHQPTESLQKELESLLKIRASKYADTIRVPRILGFVKSPVHDKIIGFLSQYIPPPDVLSLVSLGDVKASSFDVSRRKKWATQVRETVERLHEIEVAWGHAVPSNVLIHNDTDDAWVIDFDGGWMYGWTNRIVGIDEEEVGKIIQFLEV